VGITTAYTLGKLYNKPVVEVNHIMGHVFSVLVERSLESIELPYVCLTVSGGHNDFYLVTNEKLKVKNEKLSEGVMEKVGHTKHNHLAIGGILQV
jgi:tRNA A37 threonylcarbamoyltransferase TsaD